MKLKKILILSLFTLFLFTIAILMNVDINTTLVTNDNDQQDDNRLKLSNPYTNITAEEAYNMIYNKTLYPDLLALDVRGQSEYDSGHICNATLIPHTQLESRISELEPFKDTEIVVYCGSGVRSVIACEILDSHDFTKVFNMLGGMSAWNSEGYEVCIDDFDPPIWDEVPTDQLYEYCEIFAYDLDASDPSGIDEWWLNDTSFFSINNIGLITNNGLVPIGEYWLEVNVNDTYGNTLTDIFKVTVQDTTSPSWVLPPSDKTMEFGGSFNYDLDASDPSGVDNWWLNDTTYFDIDGNGVITNKGLVPIGEYWLEVNVNDTYGNTLTDKFKITVEDNIAPTWDEIPTNQPFEYGEAFNYDLNASDATGIDEWWLNDTMYFDIDGNGVITNKSLVPIGEYWLEVNVNDTYGNTLTDKFRITVEDTKPPSWVLPPSDKTMEFGGSFNYDLDASDPSNIDTWWLNDTSFFNINNAGLITNNGPVPIDEYWLEVNVNDTLGNKLTDNFKVTVQDMTSPSWVQVPSDKTMELGGTFYYDLNATDLSGIGSWELNDTLYFDIDGTGVITNKGLVPIGEYWLEVNVNDTYGNTLTDKFKITVEDTTPPSWVQVPSDKTMELGGTFNYDLNATDLSGIGSWELNDTTYFDIDESGMITNKGLVPAGVYWLEVTVEDIYNNPLTDKLKITVEDTTLPSWAPEPTDQYIDFGDGLNYDLNATDLSGIGSWELNDTTYFNVDSNGVITNITSINVGVYWLEVRVNDTFDNQRTKAFRVIVQDIDVPIWIQIPSDKNMEAGTTFNYDLNASDASGIYDWWLNDTTYFDIDDITGVITNKGLIPVGIYWLEVRAYDPYSQYCSAELKITVEDTIAPTWDETPIDQSLEYGEAFNYDLNASDTSGIDHWWLNDTTNFAIDEITGVITNTTLLEVGVYWLEVAAYDPYGHYCSSIFKITVASPTIPQDYFWWIIIIGSSVGVSAIVVITVIIVKKRRS